MAPETDTAKIQRLHFDRPPERNTAPHSLEAETAVLGGVLYDNEVFWRLAEILRADDFYAPAHKWLWRRIAALIETGKAADGIVLADAADREPKIREIGGQGYLLQLLDSAAVGFEVRDYARMISDLAARRAILAAADALRDKALDPEHGETPDAILSHARGLIDRVEERSAKEAMWESAFDAVHAELARIGDYQKTGKMMGMPTGLSKLDAALGGLHRGDVMVIGGASSMGKTALATNICLGAALANASLIVPFFSQEMTKEQLAWRLSTSVARKAGLMQHDHLIEYRALRNGSVGQNELAILKAGARLLPKGFIWNTARGLTFNDVRAGVRRARRERGGCDLVCIDYLQIMQIEQEQGENFNRSIGRVTASLKKLAGDENVAVIILSQLSRGIDGRENKRPRMTDLKESGSIENDADTVIFPYREEYYLQNAPPPWEQTAKYHEWQDNIRKYKGKLEIIVGKQRMGSREPVELHFEPETDVIVDEKKLLEEETML